MSHEFVDEMLEKSKAGELRSSVSQTLDMHLVEFSRGKAVYDMPAREERGNPLGVIQGGVATALADAATTTILTDEEIQKSAITTIDVFARFIRPVNANRVDRLRAEAKVVRAGGRLVWAEADVLAERRPALHDLRRHQRDPTAGHWTRPARECQHRAARPAAGNSTTSPRHG